MKDSHQMFELSVCFINSSLFEEINLFEWCMDWRWVNNEAACCWPKCRMLSGSTWQGKCKPDRNSALPALSSVSGQQHLSCSNLSLIPFYHWVSGSFSPSSNVSSWLSFIISHLHPVSPDSFASFFLLLVKYNIYLSLFEFTHPYHWVSSRWLRGGLV